MLAAGVVVLTLLAVLLSPDDRERWIFIGFNIIYVMAIIFFEKNATGTVRNGPTISKSISLIFSTTTWFNSTDKYCRNQSRFVAVNFLRDLISLQLALAIETILVKYVWAQQSVWSFNARNILKTIISYVICLEYCGPSRDEAMPQSTVSLARRTC